MPKEGRHHCNNCFTSYSVTVGTPLHGTRVPLSKWFRAISLQNRSSQPISSRILAEAIEVNKNTAATMLKRLRELKRREPDLIKAIVQFMHS
jgi:transposase-like protein